MRSLNRRIVLGSVSGLAATLVLATGLGAFVRSGAAASAVAPHNTAPPTISGTPREGHPLDGNRGQWSGNPTSFVYSWYRCKTVCSVIGGADEQRYVLTSADVGNRMKFHVVARNGDGAAGATSAPTAQVTTGAPQNVSPPAIGGTPKEGHRLAGTRGQWNGNPSTFAFAWYRCGTGGCAAVSGANEQTYLLTSTDVGSRLRLQVKATNQFGTGAATSAPTSVITGSTPPPPATGCPSGPGTAQIADVTPPARLVIDGQQASPAVVTRGTPQLILRYHVSDTCGQSVQGALVYVTAVPFNQFSIPVEQATGADGWAELDLRKLRGFPASQHQQLLALFVRARKQGENLNAGIAGRRLFSIPVNL